MNHPPCHYEDALWLMEHDASGDLLRDVLNVFGELRLLGIDPSSVAATAVTLAALSYATPDHPHPDVPLAFYRLRAELNSATPPQD